MERSSSIQRQSFCLMLFDQETLQHFQNIAEGVKPKTKPAELSTRAILNAHRFKPKGIKPHQRTAAVGSKLKTGPRGGRYYLRESVEGMLFRHYV